jgi:hypothetical protein
MKYFQFKKFVATKKVRQHIPPSPSFVAVVGSGIRDPRSEIRDPGWRKIRIRVPG